MSCLPVLSARIMSAPVHYTMLLCRHQKIFDLEKANNLGMLKIKLYSDQHDFVYILYTETESNTY